MHRFLRNKRILFYGVFSGGWIQEVDFEKYKEARGLFIEDPMERVKSIFMRDSFGNLHPELEYSIHLAQIGMLAGILIGGYIEAKKAEEKFKRINETTTFINRKEAQKKLLNTNMTGVIKGAFKWAPRFGLLLGGYSFVCSCCELYRNKFGVINNIVAGTVIGALYRFMYGIKGMISGGFFGAVMGTAYGLILLCLTKAGNVDQLELKYSHFAFIKYKEELKKRSEGKEDEDIKKIVESGFHVLHIPDPLEVLKEEEKKGEENQTENTKNENKK